MHYLDMISQCNEFSIQIDCLSNIILNFTGHEIY